MPDAHVELVHFGVDVDFFRHVPPVSRERQSVIAVGNDRHRDIETLSLAMLHLLALDPSLRVRAVGVPDRMRTVPGVEYLERMSARDLRNYYVESDLGILATHDNLHGSGMTFLLEMQAMGRPVIYTDSPGLSDYVHPSWHEYGCPRA